MLNFQNSHLFTYAVTRDVGFAPNPFHGICTLATCKPAIRKAAIVGDWIMGIGGSKLTPIKRHCIYLMRVSEKLTFQEYWNDSRFNSKKPLRNGSMVQVLGDNIYHKDAEGNWLQEDSHHSNSDGTLNQINLKQDTTHCEHVLISDFFIYFGREATQVNLNSIGYHTRIRDFKKTDLSKSNSGRELIQTLISTHNRDINIVIADPYHFSKFDSRVNQKTGVFLE